MPGDEILSSLPKDAKVISDSETLTSLPKDVKVKGVSTPVNKNPYYDFIDAPDRLEKLNKIVNDIPEMPGDSESKKQLWKDLALKGAPKEVLSDALLTLQGKHPHQEGGYKYYMDDNGIPKPLKNNERPPAGYEVASIWGSKSDAKDDSPITDLAKTVFNVLPGSAENLVDVVQTGVTAVTGKESDFLNSLKNSANYLKFEKDPDIQKPMLDTDGIDEFSDIVDSKRWDFSPQALWGTTLGLLGSVGEMYVGGRAVGGGIKAIQGVEKLSKPAAWAATYAGSYMTNLGEALDAADQAGLKGRDKAMFASLVTAPIAAIDAKFDLGGKITMSKLASEEKNAFIKKIAKGVAETTVDGKLTKEALDGLANATVVGYGQMAKTWTSETMKDILEQGGEEAAQQFMQTAGEQLWDKLTPAEKKKFGADITSPKAFAEYLSNFIAGSLGGAPTAFAYNKVKEQAKKDAQSNTAYGVAKKGLDAVKSFKVNVANEVNEGKLTKEEAANAIFQVDAYSEYHENTKDLNLDDAQKRRVFDLTFEKQNLERQIVDDHTNLNPIDIARNESKKKQANDIQKEINEIINKQDIENKTGPIAEKSKEDVLKKTKVKSTGEEGPVTEEGISKEKYKVPEVVKKETRSYEEIPVEDWNSPGYNTRVKQHKFAEELDKEKTKTTFGSVQQDNVFIDDEGHKVDTFNVTLPDGKHIRFASSMVRKPEENAAGGFRGNTYEENLTDKSNPVGQKVGLTVKTLKDSGRRVVFIWNADEGPKYGKHIGMLKESLRGNSNYSEADLDEMADLRMTNMGIPPSEVYETGRPNEPKGPADVKIKPTKVKLGQPTRENLRTNYINEKIDQLKAEDAYNEEFNDFYQKHFGEKYDRLNPIQNEPTKKRAVTGEESTTGDNEKSNEESASSSKKLKVKKQRAKRVKQKIKNPDRLKALTQDVYDPYHVVLQYFAGNGAISTDAVKELYKGSQKEVFARNAYTLKAETWGEKYAPSLKQLAHALWAENEDKNPSATTEDYANAIEDAIQKFLTRTDMAKALNKAMEGGEQQAPPNDEIVSDAYAQAEKEGIEKEFNAITDELEKLDDDQLKKLGDNKDDFDQWEEGTDINTDGPDDVFQKSSELIYAEGQLVKAEAELKAAKKAFDAKRKELDQNLIADQEDLFGERKSNQEASLFDERASVDARNEAIVPFKQRYEAAVANYTKWQDKVKQLGDSEESQMSLFQRRSEIKGNVEKIVEKLKKSAPGIKVVYDEDLEAAGKWSPKNKTITINPYYAGTDTPIHEYGHILIDAIGYNNKVIQAAINQLKGSKLWKETEKRYPELDQEELAKEVLAEAIGREGAEIFDKEADKSKFRTYLEYIFDWLKTKLGINKNVAKSLAKQVIAGVNFKTETAKTEKSKKQKNDISDLSKYNHEEVNGELDAIKRLESGEILYTYHEQDEMPIIAKTVEEYNNLKEGYPDWFAAIPKEKLQKPKFSKEETNAFKEQQKEKRKEEREEIKEMLGEDADLKNKTTDELIEMYERIIGFSPSTKREVFNNIKKEIAYRLFTERKEELMKMHNDLFIEEVSNKKDLHAKDVLMKTLSHMTQDFPELQKFSKMFDSTYFDMTNDRYKLKNELEKLGKAVIKEKNEKLGIRGKAQMLFSSDNAKYFEFAEHPDGRYYTVEEGKAKGFSEAQMNFLKYMHKLQDLRNQQLEAMGGESVDEVLKVDKGVKESFRTEGVLQALSAYLGNGFNIRNVRIAFSDPVTGKRSVMPYKEIENKLIGYAEKGLLQKVHAILLMLKYNMNAKRQISQGVNEDEKDNENVLMVKRGAGYQINQFGALENKFLKPRSKDRGYSKDFYKAAFEFIDDYTHTEHMSKLLPYIDSIEYLNEMGYNEHLAKPNVAKWIREWKDLHLFKNEKPGAFGPEVDAALRFLRKMTSQIVMAFNVPASLLNAAVGQYNNIRAESIDMVKEGHKRMFGGKERGEGAKKAINKKAADILEKYQVVSIDYESNPKLHIGRLFDDFAHGLTRAGEYYIQGSMFLGQMTSEEWNSFEYKKNEDGIEELVLKPGVDAKAFKEKMVAYKNRISDIQGKYGEKDRRNYMNSELGKTIAQFKVWMPDWFKERFGKKYIDADGKEHQGSYRSVLKLASKEFREQIKEMGVKNFLKSDSAEAKSFRQNIKGALTLAVLMSIRLGGDDDEKNRRRGDLVDQMVSNVLFIFDPTTVKFTAQNPIAAMKTLSRFVDVLDYTLAFEEDDFYSAKGRFGDKGDPKIWGALLQAFPYNKMLINDLTFPK